MRKTDMDQLFKSGRMSNCLYQKYVFYKAQFRGVYTRFAILSPPIWYLSIENITAPPTEKQPEQICIVL